MNPLLRYMRFLHTGFPAGTVEPLPEVGPDGSTAVKGLRIAGDLLGTPLLKLAVASGAAAVRAFAAELSRGASPTTSGDASDELLDVAVIGAGPAGVAAALECQALGLRHAVFDARAPFATIADFPAGKPIFLYPTELVPESRLRLEGATRETLLEALGHQLDAAGVAPVAARFASLGREGDHFTLLDPDGTIFARARRVLLAVGRSGARRELGVPGEALPHVRHRLHDPHEHEGRRVVVVGGGDSAAEATIAIARAGGTPTLVHRGDALTRVKPANRDAIEALAAEGRVVVRFGAEVERIEATSVTLAAKAGAADPVLPADDVLVLVGREPPVALLRRLGLGLAGERTRATWIATAFFLAIASFVYVWKSGGELTASFRERGLFPFGIGAAFASEASAFSRVLAVTLEEPGFYYSLVYSLVILGFGLRRVARTPTPYVRTQTLALGLVQWIPLFVLPYFVLPWLGRQGAFDAGFGKTFADWFFPAVTYGHGREYWRAFGFVLAFPLFIWNVFTSQPSVPWLVVSAIQTFVIIPWLVRRWGKGAYCGFICSCGALAETLGDGLRTKMPHGPGWNRLNMLGQAILGTSFLLLALRICSWLSPRTRLFGKSASGLFSTLLSDAEVLGVQVDYYHVVDITFAGILGVGLYFAYSGRVWCRFACPLAALMNLYARLFTRFRIFAEASRCIGCNQCTSVCHQGIDVMNFALRGEPMNDPECVRCSACVAVCPTATLTFGTLVAGGEPFYDTLEASPVRMREDGKRGLRVIA